MGKNTKIEWADHTASFWEGCVKIAPGCTNCYAEAFEKRVGNDVWGKLKPRKWTKNGAPLIRKLNKQAAAAGRIDTVFVNDLADFFEDFDGRVIDSHGDVGYISDDGNVGFSNVAQMGRRELRIADGRDLAFRLFDECRNLIFMLLTKRPENIRRMWKPTPGVDPHNPAETYDEALGIPYRHNVWLGTSCSDQETADKVIPELLKCRDLSPVLFVSAEPLLGAIEFSNVGGRSDAVKQLGKKSLAGIDLVITGGESGPKARPCNVDWIRHIVRQCQAAKALVFVKQLGSHVIDDRDECWPDLAKEPDFTGRIKLRHSKGGDMDEWTADLRVRQLPKTHVDRTNRT